MSLTQVACAVVEPVLGEGGFIVPPPAFLLELRRLCREAGTLFVADEVQTGFGRTGRMFACEHLDLDPDLVVLAKSMSNGFPLGAVVGRAEIMDAVPPGGLGGTFGGNPVACAAALARHRHHRGGRPGRAGPRAGRRHRRPLRRLPPAVPLHPRGARRGRHAGHRARRGGTGPGQPGGRPGRAAAALLVLTAGLHGNVIRTLMPLVMTDAELDEALDVLEAALATA